MSFSDIALNNSSEDDRTKNLMASAQIISVYVHRFFTAFRMTETA